MNQTLKHMSIKFVSIHASVCVYKACFIMQVCQVLLGICHTFYKNVVSEHQTDIHNTSLCGGSKCTQPM